MLSKTLIWLSVGGWGCVPSLFVVWGLMPWGISQNFCCQCPCPHRKPLLTHTSPRDPPALAGRSGSIPCGVTVPFLCVLVHEWFCFCPPRVKSLFLPVLEVLQLNPCGLQSQIPWGFLVPLSDSPVWENWCVAQNLHNSGRTSLVLFFSSLWLAYLVGMGFDFIIISPLLPSHCGFSFVFWGRVSLFGGFQCPTINGFSTTSCDFGALTGGDECTFFYSAILNKFPLRHEDYF